MNRKPGETPEQLRERLKELFPDQSEIQLDVMVIGIIGTKVDELGRIRGPKLTRHYDEDTKPVKGTKVP
ncbi:MAG TPA: hypothetical protein PKD34_03320 [Candidatus Doudnabacteria bacterium]|nr:hypothetical protein [Candidatus Doudnabacteria bacterium]